MYSSELAHGASRTMPLPTNHRQPFATLLLGLLALLVIYPRFERTGVGVPLWAGLLTVVLLGAVRAVASRRWALVLTLALLVPAFVSIWLRMVTPDRVPSAVPTALVLLFCMTVVVLLLEDVLTRGMVDRDVLLGAVCIYLLLGLTWAMAYSLAGMLDPPALALGDGSAPGTFGEHLYFSFVTLTTLGYGDILPVSPVARSLAYLEAAVGVLYVAMLVARLVTMYQVSGPAPDDRPPESE